jgi:hypothetical protein
MDEVESDPSFFDPYRPGGRNCFFKYGMLGLEKLQPHCSVRNPHPFLMNH